MWKKVHEFWSRHTFAIQYSRRASICQKQHGKDEKKQKAVDDEQLSRDHVKYITHMKLTNHPKRDSID